MNDRRYYSDIDGRSLGRYREIPKKRSMKEIKSDFNNHLQKYSKSKVKR